MASRDPPVVPECLETSVFPESLEPPADPAKSDLSVPLATTDWMVSREFRETRVFPDLPRDLFLVSVDLLACRDLTDSRDSGVMKVYPVSLASRV